MKLRFLLFFLLCLLLGKAANATETEPNNTAATANTLALNGSNSGIISPAGDVDWYKVTTNADGRLDLTLTPLSGKFTWIYLYDKNGTILLNSNNSNAAFTVSTDGLAAGTYYVQINTYYSTDTSSYTLSDHLTTPAQANDAEPDSTRALALTLPQNSSTTGHIDYYYNNHRDSADWYKITTNGDGLLKLTLTSGNGQFVWAYLYDNDGVTQLNANNTNSTIDISTDGLAAGTYYVRVNTYYNNGFAPYKLADTLTPPAIANDAEPDSTKALALTLPLNGSKTGHVDYFYNNHRDSADWYKITTTADGLLRLRLTSGNGQFVWAYLYDNDGVTQLNANNTNGTIDISTDGLAAGTYYVRVNTYYNNGFTPYTLADSLFSPAQANDIEPNGTKAQALTLPQNSSTTGHIDYYYNNHRDSADWYKLTTTADGLLRVRISSANGQFVWAYLYDADGVTQLNAQNTNTTIDLNTDGLAAGTYYVRVNTYYNNGFTPYTLADSLFTYNANDAEPNKYFKQAQLLTSNSTAPGHVGFYYNQVRDTVDTWKLNYTGTGNLQVKLGLLPHNVDGAYNYTWLQVYKDTTSAPIYSQNFVGSTPLIASLTGLAKGYYYIKVFEYYSNNFSAYTLGNTYTEMPVKVTAAAADTAADCGSTNSLTYKFAGVNGPYNVQLFRFGTAYGTVKTTSAKSLVFSGLPDGSYYAAASVAGASVSGKSKVIGLMPTPAGTSTTNITKSSAKTNWTVLSCAKYYSVQYKASSSATWIIKKTNGNVGTLLLNGLTASTSYVWKVAAIDSANNILATSAYTDTVPFTTPATFAADKSDELITGTATLSAVDASVYPNPASSILHIRLPNTTAQSGGSFALSLRDMNGKTVWTTQSAGAETVSTDVSRLSGGIYILQIVAADKTVTTQKVVITK